MKKNLLSPDEISVIKRELRRMEKDSSFNTQPSYTANVLSYPDKLIPFVEKHMAYIYNHPQLDPQHYLSNLRLMLRSRR